MEEESGDLELRSYPNPVEDVLSIRLPNDMKSGNLNLYNDKGQQMISEIVCETNHNVDVRYMQSGLYFVKVYNGKKQVVTKFIKK
jgi:hypothetical protein